MTKATYTYHYTYLITNTNTNMKYIGVRSCNCLPENDSYMGSSKYLTEDIRQESLANFTKEILSLFETRVEAINEEIRLHNLYDVAKNPEYYNKAKQTSTGFDTTGTTGTRTPESIQRQSESLKQYYKQHGTNNIGSKRTDKQRSDMTKNHHCWKNIDHPMLGKKHSAESKKKNRESQIGSKSSRYVGNYTTPWGEFESSPLAATEFMSPRVVSDYCVNNDKIITKQAVSQSQFLVSNDVGKSRRDLGFYFTKSGTG